MVGHGGSGAGSYLADPTFPIPSHCASVVMTSTLRVKLTRIKCCWGTHVVHPVVVTTQNIHYSKGVTTMLATSKNVLFPGHNHLLTTGTDDPSLAGVQAIIRVKCHQYRWLAGGYDLEIGHL